MNNMTLKIASGLERAFAARGFAEPSVEDLRDAAGVSLRTLYKYAPSRDAMVLMALEYRHQRYLAHVFGDPDGPSQQNLNETLEHVADWMRAEACHGCLFHSAVASAPNDANLRGLLEQHKSEVSQLAVARSRTDINQFDLMVIIEGLTQSWSLSGEEALASAKRLALLIDDKPV
jgi:AcrR family transcriptional regulator